MKFDHFDCDVAEGVVLAHTIRVHGKTFKKGRVLSLDDLAQLQGNGVAQVCGVRLHKGDVDEDQAALELARALAGSLLDIGKAVAGRCNLYAHHDGLAVINPQVINTINSYDSGIVIATLPEYAECLAQQAVASIKVIPFAIPREKLDAALEIAEQSFPAVGLQAFRPLSVALILTETTGLKESLLVSTSRVTRERVTALGSSLMSEARCRHTVEEVSSAIRSALALGPDMVLICGASITVDPADIVPSAIADCGGTIDHFGMPVEPGNMLLMAHIDETPVINMPGCSRSPKLNGLDWVMQRMAAGLPMGKSEILAMGVGGLVKDISHRWRMREQGNLVEHLQSPYRVAAIVLGAGRSSRMGERNKLLATVGGVPMLQRVVDAAVKADVCSVTVVTGSRAGDVQKLLQGCDVAYAHNAAYREGIAGSLKLGLSTLADDIDGVIILLAAMPFKLATHNVGRVNSIGNVVFLAGEERYAVPHSAFMFHGVGFDVKQTRL